MTNWFNLIEVDLEADDPILHPDGLDWLLDTQYEGKTDFYARLDDLIRVPHDRYVEMLDDRRVRLRNRLRQDHQRSERALRDHSDRQGFRGSVLPDQLKWAVNALFQVKDFANYASYEDLLQIRSLVEEKLYSVEDDSELASIIGEARREAAYIATFKDPTQVPDELWWSTTYIAVARAMVALGRFAAEIGEDV